MRLVFSQSSIFHLYRLGLIVSGKQGKKFCLSNEHEMLELIRVADGSNDRTIMQQFDAFLSTIDDELLQIMEGSGYIRRRLSYERPIKAQRGFMRKLAS